jgi:hypothetical protein
MSDIFHKTMHFVQGIQKQDEVLGIILVGSKSRGYDDQRSDDDLEVLVTEHASLLAAVEHYYDPTSQKLLYDARYITLLALQQKVGSSLDGEHWPYEQARILFDRGGTEPLIQALGTMDATFREKRIAYAAVSTTVAIGKAFKALERGYEASGRLALARGVTSLARLIFALEWRWKPTDHWLEQDAKTLADASGAFPFLIEALTTGNPAWLREAMNRLERNPEVPDKRKRAQLYTEIFHQSHAEDRVIHMLF